MSEAFFNDTNSLFASNLRHAEIEPHQVNRNLYVSTHSELQLRGVAFMLRNEERPVHGQRGGIVGDEMGCGKTFQALTAIVESMHRARASGRPAEKTLVVCSANVMYEWKKQAATHLQPGVLRVYTYFGPNRHDKVKRERDYDVIVTSYETVSGDFFRDGLTQQGGYPVQFIGKGHTHSPLSRLFTRIILDEAHNIRNPHTIRHKAVCALSGERKWALTGTLIWNGIWDLHAIFKFLEASPYAEKNTFDTFIATKIKSSSQEACAILADFLTPLEIRRTKAELNLPPLHSHVICVDMEESERMFYDALYNFSRDTVSRLLRMHAWLKRTGWARVNTSLQRKMQQHILTIILRLRQACIHPQLAIDGFSQWKDQPILTDQQDIIAERVRLLENAASRLQQLVLSRSADGGSEEECAVCFTNRPSHAVIPCGHTFCPDCLAIVEAQGAYGGAKCPMCRTVMLAHKPIEEALGEMDSNDSDDEEEDVSIAREWGSSTKIRHMMETLQQRLAEDPSTKFLIFSQWLGVLNIIQRDLEGLGIRTLRVDGQVSKAQTRSDLQDQFNKDSDITVMLCSLTCSSEGINLQGANVVFMMDPWWTPARSEQAANRAHRVGQERPVDIFHYIAQNTIECRILEMQERKRAIADATNGKRGLDEGWQGEVRRLLDL